MGSIASTLKGKVAGVPVWLLVVALTGIAFWYIHKSSASATQDTTGTPTPDTLDTNGLANGLPIQQFTTYISVPGQTTPAPTTTPPTGHTTGGPAITPIGSGKTPGPGVPIRKPLPGKQNTITYTVKSGDSLYGIASARHISEAALYNANKAVVENTAKRHGYKSSDNGHWIFPGEKLVIPA